MIISQIDTVVNDVAKGIVARLQRQLASDRRGGVMMTTGFLSKSIKAEGDFGVVSNVEIVSEDYGAYLNKGIKNVPFSFSGAGPEPGSPYIHGLVRWLGVKKGIFGKEALRAAFKIARVQKKEGAPKEPGWVDEIKDELDKKVEKDMGSRIFTAIELDVFTTLHITI